MLGCRPPDFLGSEVHTRVFEPDCKSFTGFSSGVPFKIEGSILVLFQLSASSRHKIALFLIALLPDIFVAYLLSSPEMIR
jgi:hypothetical protein